ncbi:MAG: chorismate lyase [Gammaproteobacteria bacterium]|nr:chorismate lyase [Gammaproteobacteria bacterium]
MSRLILDCPPDLCPQQRLRPGALLPDALLRLRAGPGVRDWLLHDGSLTDRIEHRFGPVGVTPDREGTGRPMPLEAACLQRRPGSAWWIREIGLSAGDRLRLRARTLVPPDAARLHDRLRGLGSTPLGRVLFRGDRLRRGVVRGARGFARGGTGDWLRLTRYRVDGESLLVVERVLAGADAARPLGAPLRARPEPAR